MLYAFWMDSMYTEVLQNFIIDDTTSRFLF